MEEKHKELLEKAKSIKKLYKSLSVEVKTLSTDNIKTINFYLKGLQNGVTHMASYLHDSIFKNLTSHLNAEVITINDAFMAPELKRENENIIFAIKCHHNRISILKKMLEGSKTIRIDSYELLKKAPQIEVSQFIDSNSSLSARILHL